MTLIINQNIDKAAQRDIAELNEKIQRYRAGEISDEKFRSFRLARGVYGQRQIGVQMIRIKLPYGRLTSNQLARIADCSDEFASSCLHATTRQDIQIHFVKLERAPELWNKLEEEGITLREACGNTVRNVTASADAGVNAKELFDVTPYAHAFFEYFLRNPICQEMGRKFKVAFASTDEDSAYTFIHDIGFIPRIKTEDGVEQRGFKVVIGGGLGAQPFMAQTVSEFMHVDDYIPFSEAIIRIFDRFGERSRRHKARFKYLLHDLGLDELMELVKAEYPALKNKKYVVHVPAEEIPALPQPATSGITNIADPAHYEAWVKANTFVQKQAGYRAVGVKLTLGNMKSDKARAFATVVKKYAADDIRVTVNQGYLLRFVKEDLLPHLYNELNALELAEAGFDSVADITACPGTDTCNLGIASSYGLAEELERLMKEEYRDLVYNNDIKIKISGCMNACGQHTIANIGFHGMSIKSGDNVMPGMQVLLGGGFDAQGNGIMAEKVTKLPAKAVPAGFRALMDDYEANRFEGEYFNAYFQRKGNNYFYQLLKPYAETKNISADYFVDWGNAEQYEKAVGVGECAGVILDLVETLLGEAKEKLALGKEALALGYYSDAAYQAYNTFVTGAKALLLGKDVNCNTQIGIIRDFDTHYVATGEFEWSESFENTVLQINKNEPGKAFAEEFLQLADKFLRLSDGIRAKRTSDSLQLV